MLELKDNDKTTVLVTINKYEKENNNKKSVRHPKHNMKNKNVVKKKSKK